MKIIIKATEDAAIAASHFIGSGDKAALDGVATEAMRKRLEFAHWTGVVKIGEGRKDNMPGLFFGDVVGRNWPEDDGKRLDISCDPVDGTTQCSNFGNEAVSVMAVAKKDMMWNGQIDGKDQYYMLKLAYGSKLKEAKLKITDSLEEILVKSAKTLNKSLNELMVCMLNRPRHKTYIDLMRRLGVRTKLIQDCDVTGAMLVCRPDKNVDLYFGVGGAPEAVLAAAAIKCLGGDFQAIPADADGVISGKTFSMNDLVAGPCAFAATGILDGSLLKGVKVEDGKYVTNSIFLRSDSGTVRWINTVHGN